MATIRPAPNARERGKADDGNVVFPCDLGLFHQAGAAMTLVEALKTMRKAGFIQAKDTHSRFFKNIEELFVEAELDLNDYTPNT